MTTTRITNLSEIVGVSHAKFLVTVATARLFIYQRDGIFKLQSQACCSLFRLPAKCFALIARIEK